MGEFSSRYLRGSASELPKYFPCSRVRFQQIVQNGVALTHNVPHVEITLKYINIYAYMSSFAIYRGQVRLGQS